MSFAPDTEKLVNELIQAEYENACKQAGKEFNDEYTDKYHSLYEGYAVLKEEIEEASTELKFLDEWLDDFWESIKNNNFCCQKESLKEMTLCVKDGTKELAQVGAVLLKIKNTLEVDK